MEPTTQFQEQALKQLSEIFSSIPFNQMLGLRLETVEKDCITMKFAMKKELIGNYLHGILHGGVISSVLDMAGGVAAMITTVTKYEEKDFEHLKTILGKASTTNLHVNFIRPGKGEIFTAKAWILHSGNKVSFARMELYNEKGALIASGAGTYMIG